MTNMIQEGDHVLLRRDGHSVIQQVKRKRNIRFDRVTFTLDGIIGEPFGASFKVNNGQMIRISDPDAVLKELMETDVQGTSGKDNRNLVGGQNNQKLSQKDILKMKEEGKAGEEIMSELVSNSETFASKTEYSQKKWLKKRMKKHVFIFTVLKPTARLLIDMVYIKSPEKICHLRIDSLSQILTYANIMSGVKVAVVDTLQGLIVGSVMERMGGAGEVVQFYPDSDVNRHIVDYFDFPKEFKDKLYNYPLKELPKLRLSETSDTQQETTDTKGDIDNGDNTSADTDSANGAHVESMQEGSDKEPNELGMDEAGSSQSRKRKADDEMEEDKRLLKEKNKQYVKQLILQKNFDCLIVACKYHPTPIVLALLEFIAPSRPVVVYSALKEPLMDCYTSLKMRNALNIRLTETWYREYQVLPGQTHPTMQMTGTGGYLLTCTTVSS